MHRVLVVDNYDSFTYNLVHGLRRCVGEQVTVVVNDDREFLKSIRDCNLKEFFDLIVLSPGPGNPHTDIGCVSEYIIDHSLSSENPFDSPVVFGVCMGYEAIGVRCGARLVKTVPRHGVRWPVYIDRIADADTLFEGVPDVVQQVRYHSLILDPGSLAACEDLIFTSFSNDVDPASCAPVIPLEGPCAASSAPAYINNLSLTQLGLPSACANIRIPMSFRHKRLPIYAVQFHPESVWSDHGQQLIENIVRLSHTIGGDSKMTVPYSSEGRLVTGKQQCRLITTLSKEELGWWSEEVFSSLFFSEDKASVWLDSPLSTTGRWSFLAGGQQAGRLFVVLEERGGSVAASQGEWPHTSLENRSIDQVMRAIFDWSTETFGSGAGESGPPVTVPAVFTCLGYEATTSSVAPEGINAALIITDRVIAIDNESGEVFALSLEWDDWSLSSEPPVVERSPVAESTADRPEPVFRIRDSKSQYIEKVKTCQLAIEQGESYELCLTTGIVGKAGGLDPLQTYKTMRRVNPAPNSAFFHFPSSRTSLLMASPERFLRVEQGIAQVKPIKGTRPRGRTPDEDAEIVAELAASTKDSAENLMIVDLVRNDLTRVCKAVECPALMVVETYPPYHQLVSTVQGHIHDRKIAEAVFALFPAGSMTGAPKKRSMELLEAIEGTRRGIGYSGAVGVCSPCSNYVDLAVSIRAITINGETNEVSLGVGGAVLAVSDPQGEWREMVLKGKRNLAVIAESVNAKGVILQYGESETESMFIRSTSKQGHCPVTTMRYEKGRGVWLWHRHIRRLSIALGVVEELVAYHLTSAIQEAVNRVDTELYEKFTPLSEGPFRGVSSKEWTNLELGDIKACRIRCEAKVGELGDPSFTVTATPLVHEAGIPVRAGKIRVDSADAGLTCKTADWYVPGVDTGMRAHTLLVDEQDQVTETGIANVAVFQDGEWVTPSASSTSLLPGLLREILLEQGYARESPILYDRIVTESPSIVGFNSVRGVFSIHLE